MAWCGICGAGNDPDSSYCRQCGQSFSDHEKIIYSWPGLHKKIIPEVTPYRSSSHSYSTDELRKRVRYVQDKVSDLARDGALDTSQDRSRYKEVLEKVPRGDGRSINMRHKVNQLVYFRYWHDLLTTGGANNRPAYSRGAYREHLPSPGKIPNQGWKIHIAAHPNEMRPLIKAFHGDRKFASSVNHKFASDIDGFDRLRIESKAATIYPAIDGWARDYLGGHTQRFVAGNQDHNFLAMNANIENTANIIEKVSETISSSPLPIEGGPSILREMEEEDSDEKDAERQVGNTRIYYRYGACNGGNRKVLKTPDNQETISDGVLGKEGQPKYSNYVIPESLRGKTLEQVERQVEQIRSRIK